MFSCSSSAGRRCCRVCDSTALRSPAPRSLASPSSPSGPSRRIRPLRYRRLPPLRQPSEGGNLTARNRWMNFPRGFFFFYSRATVCWFFRRQSHPAAGPRLSWGCRRSPGPRRPGRGRPPGGSRTGAVEAPRPGSPAAIRWVRRAERLTGATEPPCWRRDEHTHIFYDNTQKLIEPSCIRWVSAKFCCCYCRTTADVDRETKL